MPNFKAKQIIIDSNVVLDFLLKRGTEVHQSNINKIFQSSIHEVCEGAITASTITDLYYIMQESSALDAHAEVRKIMQLTTVLSVTEEDCLNALDSKVADFEDAVLTACAKRGRIERIVTNNAKDFANSGLIVYTAEEFAAQLNNL